jgi:hypothetical protein
MPNETPSERPSDLSAGSNDVPDPAETRLTTPSTAGTTGSSQPSGPELAATELDLPAPAAEAPPVTAASTKRRLALPLALEEPLLDERALTPFVAALMALASIVMVLWNLQDASLNNANTASRYATIESLVDYGTYTIDKSQYVHTIDKKKIGDHYISSKPPLLPTYGAGVYWAYQKLTGKNIVDNEGDVVRTVGFFTTLLAHAVFLLYLYRFSRMLFKRPLAVLGTMAMGSFGYLGVAYATAINNHSVGACLSLVGLFYAYRATHGSAGYKDWILAGFWLGITAAIDLTCLAFLPTIGLYMLVKDWRRAVFAFGAAALPGVIVLLGLNYFTTGSLKAAYLNKEAGEFAGNYFKTVKHGIDGLREPKHIYGFNVLLGHHGVFSMTPVFCFSLYELIRNLRRREHFKGTLAITAVLAMVFYFYIFRTRNYGGWCVGMRWIVPFMPLFVLYFGLWLDRVKHTRLTLGAAALAFAIGCFHVQDGLTSPFQYSVWHNWLEHAPNRGRVGKTFNLSKTKKKRQKNAAVDAPSAEP